MVVSLCHLVGDRPLTAEEERLAFTLGWCIELVSSKYVYTVWNQHFLVCLFDLLMVHVLYMKVSSRTRMF